MKMAVFWVVVPCSLVEVCRRFRGNCWLMIALMMEAASSSETSVNFYQTKLHATAHKTTVIIYSFLDFLNYHETN
jgi:hypothetical protein